MQERKKSSKKKEASVPSMFESAKEAKSPKVEEEKVEAKTAPAAPPAPTARPVLVSFARWFAARSREKGWKPHWVAGMKAYANTAGRLPMAGWDDLFKSY